MVDNNKIKFLERTSQILLDRLAIINGKVVSSTVFRSQICLCVLGFCSVTKKKGLKTSLGLSFFSISHNGYIE